MSNEVDAVIAALKATLKDAESRSSQVWWNVDVVNRWIAHLPAAWTGRWRHLKLSDYRVSRGDLIGHIRATLAFLETHRDGIRKMTPWSWSMPASTPAPGQPLDADFADVPTAEVKKLARPGKPSRTS